MEKLYFYNLFVEECDLKSFWKYESGLFAFYPVSLILGDRTELISTKMKIHEHLLKNINFTDIYSDRIHNHATISVDDYTLAIFPVYNRNNDFIFLVIEASEKLFSEEVLKYFTSFVKLLSNSINGYIAKQFSSGHSFASLHLKHQSLIASKLNCISTIPEAVSIILNEVTKISSLDSSSIFTVSPNEERYSLIEYSGFEDDELSSSIFNDLFPFNQIKKKKSKYFNYHDLQELNLTDHEKIKFRTIAFIPVIFEGAPMATLVFASHKNDEMGLPIIQFLESIALILGGTLARIDIEEALEESDDRYKLLFETSNDAIMILDKNKFVDCNKKTLEMFKLDSKDSFIRHHPSDLSPVRQPNGASSYSLANQHMKKAFEEGFNKFNWVHMRKTGEEFQAEVWLTSFKLNNRSVLQATVRDTTKETNAQNKLQRIKEQLEITNKGLNKSIEHANQMALEAQTSMVAKSRFLAKMSHEIRTPMSGIIGIGELLLESELSDAQYEYVSTIVNSANSLLVILNDILDYSKMEAGKLSFDSISFSFRKLLDNLSTILGITAQEKGINYNVFVNPDVPDTLIGDPIRLRQVLLNIIGNAIKFTLTGEVSLEVVLSKVEEDSITLKFHINDTGVGIPNDKLSHIFDTFAQADTSVSRIFGGTGLGLSISKLLVERMNGIISIESEVSKGTKFTFTAQFVRSEDPSENIDISIFTGKKVLIFDSDETSRSNLTQTLKSWGIDARGAGNNLVALEKIRGAASTNTSYDLIVHYEKDKNAISTGFIKQLHEDNYGKNLPILLITDLGTMISTKELDSNGITAHINKPVKESAFYEALKTSFTRNPIHTTRPIYTNNSPSPFKKDYSNTSILVVDDNRINQKVASKILMRYGIKVKVAVNGMDALEKLENGDFDMVFMDIEMPIMDGIEATKQIRNSNTGVKKDITIIGMTAYTVDSIFETCIKSGMNGYITKPLRPADIYKILETYI